MLEIVYANVVRGGRRIWRLYLTNTLSILIIILLFAYLDGSHRQLDLKNSVFFGQFVIKLSREVDDIEQKIKQEFAELDYMTKKVRTNVTYRSGLDSSGSAELIGVEIETDSRFKEYITFFAGHYIENDRDILIPSSLLQHLDVKVGDPIMVMGKTAEGQFNTGAFLVSGIYNDPGFNLFSTPRLILSYDAMREFFIPRETDVEYGLYFKGGAVLNNLKKRTRDALSDSDQTLIKTMRSTETTASNVLDISVQFTLFLYVMMAITILVFVSVVIVVNFNIYMILYRKRKKEIGTLMALGVTPATIGTMLIFEALLQILICLLLAFTLAHGISFLASFQIASGFFELIFVLLSGTNRVDLYVQYYQVLLSGAIVVSAMLLFQIPLVLKIIFTKPIDMIVQH
jgi:ABC-type antimicrobial peptide transport system permease subunit